MKAQVLREETGPGGLELVDVIATLADDLATFPEWPIGEFQPATDASAWWLDRYPPD